MLEVDQRSHARVDDEHHTATVAAITAGRTSHRSVLFTPECDGPAATVTCFYAKLAFVDEVHGLAL
jgi:hypothetical protein